MKDIISVQTSVLLDEAKAKIEDKKAIASMVLNTDDNSLWYLDDQMIRTDQIVAQFTDKAGKKGEKGNASVWISLLGGKTFVAPYITAPKPGGDGDLEGIEYSLEKDDSILVLEFIEPGENETYDHPVIIFHTSDGEIDPEISVTRGVGG